jgi:hypothetical protein
VTTLWKLLHPPRRDSRVMSKTVVLALPWRLSAQLASRVQCLSWLFIFQDISWLHCNHFFIVSQLVNSQEQTSSQTKWHYEKQTPDTGTSAKQMGTGKEGKKKLWKDWHDSTIYKMLLHSSTSNAIQLTEL